MTATAQPPGEVLLDVSRLIWRAWERRLPTGIDRTCQAYLAHFGARARLVVQRQAATLILSPRRSAAVAQALLAPAPATRRQLAALIAGAMPGGSRLADATSRIYLNIGHTGLDQPGHRRWIKEKDVRAVYFVHDLIPITHPEYCRPGEDVKHAARMRQVLDCARAVICNSVATRDELAGFAAAQGLPMPAAAVAPLGVEPPSLAQGAPLVGPPYFVMLGTIESRKNHLMLLQVWADLARRLGPTCPHLHIIGQRGWECEQAVDLLDRAVVLRGLVHEHPRASDSEVAGLIRGARALLFPSFAEGFGLPLVEALALGTPVLASDLPVFRELAGERPDYLSPIDGLGWRDAIQAYATDDAPARAAQMARLAGYAPPDWPTHFRIVETFLSGT